jgi:KTSC domain
MPTMRNVYSSHIDKVGYDSERQEFHVHWQTGRKSIYSNVPPPVAHQILGSASFGSAITSMLKNGKFPHRYA